MGNNGCFCLREQEEEPTKHPPLLPPEWEIQSGRWKMVDSIVCGSRVTDSCSQNTSKVEAAESKKSSVATTSVTVKMGADAKFAGIGASASGKCAGKSQQELCNSAKCIITLVKDTNVQIEYEPDVNNTCLWVYFIEEIDVNDPTSQKHSRRTRKSNTCIRLQAGVNPNDSETAPKECRIPSIDDLTFAPLSFPDDYKHV